MTLESKLIEDKTVDKKSFSDRLVMLVQVVFAVVIGGSLIEFRDILFPPKNTIEVYALVGVYVTATTSWTGYHYRMEQYPYTRTKLGVLRLFTDVFIVITYTFLLFVGTRQWQSIETYPIESYLWGFSVVFLLYVIAGLLRRKEYGDQKASRRRLLIKFFYIYSLSVPLLFRILTYYGGVSTILLNQIFVWFPLVAMLIFRWRHEWKYLQWRELLGRI